MLEHVGQHLLAAQVHAGEVDLLDATPGIDAGLQDRIVIGRRDAGVVECDIDTAVGVLGHLEHRGDVVGTGDVGANEGATDFGRCSCTGCRLHVSDDDLGTLVGEASRGGQADATAATGDDGDASFESTALGLAHGIAFRLR